MTFEKKKNYRKYDNTDYLPTLEEFRKEFPYDKYDDLTKNYYNQDLKNAQKKTRTT